MPESNSEEFFGKGKSKIKISGKEIEWDWESFKNTENFPVSDNLLDWVIGQDKALQECYLCLDEWVQKLKFLKKEQWWKDWETPLTRKNPVKERLSPGPYLLLLGDPGTGKSLIGRALAMKLTELYKENDIELSDVVCWSNKVIPGEPRISIHPSPLGQKVINQEKVKEVKRQFLKKTLFKLLQGIMIGTGVALLSFFLYFLGNSVGAWIQNSPYGYFPSIQQAYNYNFLDYMIKQLIGIVPYTAIPGGSLIFFGIMVGWFTKFLGGQTGMKGIGGAESSDVPKLLIDNSSGKAPFIDATGHSSSQLFGSIAWDPYQTGGLGTPEHQRVTAGDVHRACLGILYIDEIKNLYPEEAITLLTVLEDGQLPVTLRSRWHGGETAAMAVSTEPIPSVTFLVAAGNFDSINQIHPALMDRIYGYGKVVKMNNDMPDTIENRRKYVQFISQEIKRFNLMPFSREACIEIVAEGRRRSDKRDALSTKFRPLISVIKTASVLASNSGQSIVESKYVVEAIEEHCKTIQKQILEHKMAETEKFLEIDPKGTKLGQIYGLAIVSDPVSQAETGAITRLKAQMIPKAKLSGKKLGGYYVVTGVAKGTEEKYIADSIMKVRSVILKKYGIDIAQEYMTHLDFSQDYGIDGPSAGVTMTLAICSILEGKPLRQDVAVTGEINVSSDDEIEVTAVGGLYEKIKSAEKLGFKTVVIPYRNYKYSIDPKDFNIKIVPGKNLDDYLKVLLSDQ